MKCCVMDSTSISKILDVVYFRYKVTADTAACHQKKSLIRKLFADGNLLLGKVCSLVWGKSTGVFGA
jgi:hypothetical protein